VQDGFVKGLELTGVDADVRDFENHGISPLFLRVRDPLHNSRHARSSQKRDDLPAKTARRVLDAHASGLVGKAPVFGRTRRGAVLRAIRHVAKPGKPCRLALGFAPCGSSRKSHAAHGASYAEGP
jgi:hypothetical protein